MKTLIATDLDGTLFYPKKRIGMINKQNLLFLRRHIDAGGKVVLVSGRNNQYLEKVAKKIDRKVDFIGCNSSFIVADGEIIRSVPFDVEKTKTALKEIKRDLGVKGYFIMSSDNRFIIRNKFNIFYRIGYKLWNLFQGVYKEPSYVSQEEFDKVLDEGLGRKIMVFFGIGKKNILRSKEANKYIAQKYGDIFESSWSNEFIELSPHGCSKSMGLKYYADYININHSDVYVVGDSGNDISMFKEFPENSFCMSHASLSVSKYAKHVIKKFDELEKFIVYERK